MSDADKAYAAAERRIEEAKREGDDSLSFDQEETHALDHLPPSIAELTELRDLDLNNTQVSDIAPLAALTRLNALSLNDTQVSDIAPLAALTRLTMLSLNNTQVSDIAPLAALTRLTGLWLHNTQVSDIAPLAALTRLTGLSLNKTQVSDIAALAALTRLTTLSLNNTQARDLRPLRRLTRLVTDPGPIGLTFTNCTAAQQDPEIARIAKIEDNKTRARILFDYLEDWQPPRNTGPTPAPDPLFPVAEQEGRLEVTASCPTAEEQEDALKRAMHRSLPALLERLAQMAGNQFPRLADLARHLVPMLQDEFEALDMAMIHLALNELRAAERAGAEEGMPFPGPLAALLSSVCDAGGGLTVDHPTVTLLMERARKARDNPDPEQDTAAQDALSHQIIAGQQAMGDRLRALESAIVENPSAQAREAQKAVNRNVLWRIAVISSSMTMVVDAVTGKVLGDLLGQPVVDFVLANLPTLQNAALTYGAPFAEWFLSALSKVPEFAALIVNVPDRPDRRQ